MDSRLPVDARALGIMVLLCTTWGLQQITLKVATPDVTPVMQIALRSGIAALLVGLLMLWQKEKLAWNRHWRPALTVGVLFALEFLLLGEALRLTTASHAVVLLYTGPIYVALGLHFLIPAERLRPRQWLGILLAFAGIALSFWGHDSGPGTGNAPNWMGDVLALLSGLAWGATTVLIRSTSLARAPASETLLYQLIAGFVILLGAALLLGQARFNPTPLAWGSLLFQGVIVSFVSYLAWFRLLRVYAASQLGVYSFMTPLLGVAFGIWLLNDPVEPGFLLGALMVIGGIVLVSAKAPQNLKA